MRCVVIAILVQAINLEVKANKSGSLNGACYRDTFTRKLLQGKAILNLNPNSPEICKSICQEENFKFAGVEAGTNCYCGNHLVHKNHPKVSQKHCRTPCPGNPAKFCGGKKKKKGKKKLYMNLYSINNQQCSKPSGDLPGLPRKYCQPGESCWPSPEDVKKFSEKIHGNESSCLGYAQDTGTDRRLKKFVYVNDPNAHVRICLPYIGLTPSDLHCPETITYVVQELYTGKNEEPDPKCNSNPFITGAYYKNDTDKKDTVACMTPYQFLNNRNYKKEWMAAFILTASTQEDVIAGIKFANYHNLGISVISTGHELVDRNAGPGPNSFLIRTTCFTDWNPHPDDPIEGYNGTIWTDGYVELGAGHTFGTNFWWDIPNSEGVYALAAKHKREMVGGTCHSVGIVGWTMGGGRGWTAPMYGIGVNQLLHVDMVTADGEPISANFSHNKELFWAIRGGGPGFGVITSMKVKLHKPKCTDSNGDITMKNCYTIWTVQYGGEYKGNSTVSYVKNLLYKYSKWSIELRPTWTSVVSFYYNNSANTYSVEIEGRYFAYEDHDPSKYWSFVDTFTDTFNRLGDINHTTTDKYWCEYFPNPNNTSDCYNIPWHLDRWPEVLPFMMNSSILENDFLGTLLDTWQPLCENFPYSACATGYQFRGDMAAVDPKTGRGVYATPNAVSNGFNSASFDIFVSDLRSIKVDLTYDQKVSFYHENLAPKIYKFSNNSYFNEAEYTLSPGQWERRFWGKEIHSKLLQIKEAYDPKLVFTCHHCIGSEVGTEPRKEAQCLKNTCSYNGIQGKCVADGSPYPLNYVKTDGNCGGGQCACWIPQTKKFCQPVESCWPSESEIDQFSMSINGKNHSCLGLRKFVHSQDEYAHDQICLPYTGLLDDNPCKTKNPYLHSFVEIDCSAPDPFTTGAYYNSEGLACMTPYQFLNMRNYKLEWMAAFIVTADSKEDISLALQFARKHNLGVSVINTGHDWQDRTAGPGPNTLQIRTTCFRHWEPETEQPIDHLHGTWYDGHVRLGAGLTFGQNFWTNVTNAKGIYKLAAEKEKEMVGGRVDSVGIAGCTLGGCRGWTSPMYGLGVDQLLHVDIVLPNGTFSSANYTHNDDLFYALRGGGGGFGIIYSMTIKMHNASCTDPQTGLPTMKDCYTYHYLDYTGNYDKSESPNYVKTLLELYFSWSVETRSHGWNSVLSFFYNKEKNEYTVQIGAQHFGYSDSSSFFDKFTGETKDLKNKTTEKSSDYFCNGFKDNKCYNQPWHLDKWIFGGIWLHVNSSITTNGFADTLMKVWQPNCDKFPYSACASGFAFEGDLPAIDPATGEGVHSTGGAISPGFRTTSLNMFNLGVNSENLNLTYEQKFEWMHYSLGPEMYKFSNSSYFNEAEYTLDPGQWQHRFWDAAQHEKLIKIKQKYDPDLNLNCRHCVGSDVGE